MHICEYVHMETLHFIVFASTVLPFIWCFENVWFLYQLVSDLQTLSYKLSYREAMLLLSIFLLLLFV